MLYERTNPARVRSFSNTTEAFATYEGWSVSIVLRNPNRFRKYSYNSD